MNSATTSRVRELNDRFRTGGPATGDWVITCGVQAVGPEFPLLAMLAVRAFNHFTSDNDPYGEHDFGSLSLAGQTLFWKIDYYDLSLACGSADPADPSVTRRVLTIMLASEY